MDLLPIEARADEFFTWIGRFDSGKRVDAALASAADVPDLIDEVKRLRSICEDHALCADAISTLRAEIDHLRADILRRQREAFAELSEIDLDIEESDHA